MSEPHLESISIERLESVETLVGAVGPPVPPDPRRPGQLGNDTGHSETNLTLSQVWKVNVIFLKCSSISSALFVCIFLTNL